MAGPQTARGAFEERACSRAGVPGGGSAVDSVIPRARPCHLVDVGMRATFLASSAACGATVAIGLAACGGSVVVDPEAVPAAADADESPVDGPCWRATIPATCNPRSPVACSETASCELAIDGTIAISCTGPAPVGEVGAACDNATTGCAPGLLCHLSTCEKACCASEDCAPGESCRVLYGQLGTLGTCGR